MAAHINLVARRAHRIDTARAGPQRVHAAAAPSAVEREEEKARVRRTPPQLQVVVDWAAVEPEAEVHRVAVLDVARHRVPRQLERAAQPLEAVERHVVLETAGRRTARAGARRWISDPWQSHLARL
jgi:hypothetical protein